MAEIGPGGYAADFISSFLQGYMISRERATERAYRDAENTRGAISEFLKAPISQSKEGQELFATLLEGIGAKAQGASPSLLERGARKVTGKKAKEQPAGPQQYFQQAAAMVRKHAQQGTLYDQPAVPAPDRGQVQERSQLPDVPSIRAGGLNAAASLQPQTAPGAAARPGLFTPLPPIPETMTKPQELGAEFEIRSKWADKIHLTGADRTNAIFGKPVEKEPDAARLADMGLWKNAQTGVIEPAPEEMQSPGFKLKVRRQQELEQRDQDLNEYRDSQTELNRARASVERMKSTPGSPLYGDAMTKMSQAQERLDIARQRLNLSKEQQEFKETGPTVTTRTKAQQAGVVKQSGEELLAWIDAHPEAFGIQIAGLSEAAQSRNPVVAEAATKLRSFAALQPALHGSRGIGMQREFEGAVGMVWSTPEVLKQRVRALMSQADKFEQAGEFHKGAEKTSAPKTGADGITFVPKQ